MNLEHFIYVGLNEKTHFQENLVGVNYYTKAAISFYHYFNNNIKAMKLK